MSNYLYIPLLRNQFLHNYLDTYPVKAQMLLAGRFNSSESPLIPTNMVKLDILGPIFSINGYIAVKVKYRPITWWEKVVKHRKCTKSHTRVILHWYPFKVRVQRSGIDTIKYHAWPRIPMGKWQTHSRHHKREPRGQPFPSRWPQSTYKQTRTKT